jgi:hypothetical protein
MASSSSSSAAAAAAAAAAAGGGGGGPPREGIFREATQEEDEAFFDKFGKYFVDLDRHGVPERVTFPVLNQATSAARPSGSAGVKTSGYSQIADEVS